MTSIGGWAVRRKREVDIGQHVYDWWRHTSVRKKLDELANSRETILSLGLVERAVKGKVGVLLGDPMPLDAKGPVPVAGTWRALRPLSHQAPTDFIISSNHLAHEEDPSLGLRTLNGALVPTGHLLLIVPLASASQRGSHHSTTPDATQRTTDFPVAEGAMARKNVTYSPRLVRQIMEHAGFTVNFVETVRRKYIVCLGQSARV